MKENNIAPKMQAHPELYGWDYSVEQENSDEKKSFTGVGFVIIYLDGSSDLIHFNDSWNTDRMTQIPYHEECCPSYSREMLNSDKSNFKFICELP